MKEERKKQKLKKDTLKAEVEVSSLSRLQNMNWEKFAIAIILALGKEILNFVFPEESDQNYCPG